MKNLILAILLSVIANYAYAQIPDLEVQDINGNSYKLSHFTNDNSHYLISFWTSWCGPCRKEFEAWKAYSSKWRNEFNVKILLISIDKPNAYNSALRLWENSGVDGGLLFADAENAQDSFDVTSIPRVFLFDMDGGLMYKHKGFSSGNEVELDEIITSSFYPIPIANRTQDKEEYALSQSELKFNVASIFGGYAEVSFERIIDSFDIAVGIAIGGWADENIYTFSEVALSPYCRNYFGRKMASGFFLEGNGTLILGRYGPRGSVSIGAATGFKLVKDDGWSAEILLGAGTFINGLDNIFDNFHPRFALNVGKRLR